MNTLHVIFSYIVLSVLVFNCSARNVTLTNIKCRNLDETFLKITKCFAKPIVRKSSLLTVNVTLFDIAQIIVVKIKFLKKSNLVYNTYLYNEKTVDLCEFFVHRKSRPILRYLFTFIESYSNLNHTCPYKGYVLLDRLKIDHKKLTFVPIPSGDYALAIRWFANGRERFQVGVNFTYTE